MRPYVRIGSRLRGAVGPSALAVGIAASDVVGALSGVGSGPLLALTVAVVVVTALVLAGRGGSGPSARELGLRRPRAALTGIGVMGGAAAVVLLGDCLLGGTRVTGIDLEMLLTFLLANGSLAIVQEAVPEELALRGHTVAVLRRGHGAVVTVVGSALAFVAAATAGAALGSAITWLLGLSTGPVRFAPGAQPVLDYVVLIALFGVVLALLRLVCASLWASIAGHLTFLLVNRVLIVPRPDTGVAVDTPAGAELLVPAYLLVAALLLLGAGAARRRRDRCPPRGADRPAVRLVE